MKIKFNKFDSRQSLKKEIFPLMFHENIFKLLSLTFYRQFLLFEKFTAAAIELH
jgi:hypothetical protein